MTPETIVQLRPDHPPTPNTLNTANMNELTEEFFKELSNLLCSELYSTFKPHITTQHNKCDLIKVWQSAVTKYLMRDADEMKVCSNNYYGQESGDCSSFSSGLRNSLRELIDQKGPEFSYLYKDGVTNLAFYMAGQNTFRTFYMQYFRMSRSSGPPDVSELAPTQEDEA